MNKYTRRDFINTNALAALSLPFSFLGQGKYKPLLSFATLGCPDWSLDKILKFAVQFGFDGIEFRGLNRQFDLTQCFEFNGKDNIMLSAKRIAEHKIKIVDLGCSAVMHFADAKKRKENLDLAKKFIVLAQELNCPFVRVFPDQYLKELEKEKSVTLIAEGLRELGDFAKDTGVKVLLSTHGDVVHSTDVENIMQMVGYQNVGVGWDIVNMWSATNERIPDVYNRLKKYIHLVHVKNLKIENGKEQIVLMSEGNTPVFEGIDLLAKDKYNGYYSFVWEKYWFPELPEPEQAFTDYITAMRQHFLMAG